MYCGRKYRVLEKLCEVPNANDSLVLCDSVVRPKVYGTAPTRVKRRAPAAAKASSAKPLTEMWAVAELNRKASCPSFSRRWRAPTRANRCR